MPITLIVAADDDWGIGIGNSLPWPHIPSDMARFKKFTNGHPVIMGRKTFESLPNALPKRTNIVITRNLQWVGEGAIACCNLANTLNRFQKENPFVIGGKEIYKQALPFCDMMMITRVSGIYPCDTYWKPDFSPFVLTDIQYSPLEERPICRFETFRRKGTFAS